MSAPWALASWSSERLAWRAFRATSVVPFLWPSSSSRTTIGRKMSCSSKRNSDVGSCIRTLVSRTKVFVPTTGPERRRRELEGAGDKGLETGPGSEVRAEMKVGATDAGWSSRSMMGLWLMLAPAFDRKGRFVFGARGVPSLPIPECDFLYESR